VVALFCFAFILFLLVGLGNSVPYNMIGSGTNYRCSTITTDEKMENVVK
jgi:hypothetical protein